MGLGPICRPILTITANATQKVSWWKRAICGVHVCVAVSGQAEIETSVFRGCMAGSTVRREREGSANHSARTATAHYFGGLAGMLASLVNVSLLNQNTDYVAVCFVQHPNNIRDGQFVIREEITNGNLALGDLVKSI